jgi:hypothetical protein
MEQQQLLQQQQQQQQQGPCTAMPSPISMQGLGDATVAAVGSPSNAAAGESSCFSPSLEAAAAAGASMSPAFAPLFAAHVAYRQRLDEQERRSASINTLLRKDFLHGMLHTGYVYGEGWFWLLAGSQHLCCQHGCCICFSFCARAYDTAAQQFTGEPFCRTAIALYATTVCRHGCAQALASGTNLIPNNTTSIRECMLDICLGVP